MKNTKDADNHLGVKLAAEMKRRGLDKKQVAELFGVTVPSVYDWLSHGRIAKRHYATLVRVFKRPMEWWFNAPAVPSDTIALIAGEPRIDYTANTTHQELVELFNALPDTEQAELLNQLRSRRAHYERMLDELVKRKKLPNRTLHS